MIQVNVDAHCHINFCQHPGDVALACEKHKVHTIYVTTLPSHFEDTYDYVKSLTYVHPALGFHALESDYNLENERTIFLRNIDKTQYIGEIGLDFSRKLQVPQSKQIENFEFILNAIKGKNKIVSVHSLNAEDEVIDLLHQYGIKKVILHWYTGKVSSLKKAINYGYYFSINKAMITSKSGQNIISKLPKNLILIETDAPFIKDVLPYMNDEVYRYLQSIWQISLEQAKLIVLDNFKSLHKNRNIHSLFDLESNS